MEPKTLLIRCVENFKLPGQTIADFKKEVDRLTDSDKVTLTAWFNESGIPTKLS